MSDSVGWKVWVCPKCELVTENPLPFTAGGHPCPGDKLRWVDWRPVVPGVMPRSPGSG